MYRTTVYHTTDRNSYCQCCCRKYQKVWWTVRTTFSHEGYIAIDNTDFVEDTVDGKGTTHRTITTVYQKADVPGKAIAPNHEPNDAQSLSVLPYHGNKPKAGPDNRDQKFKAGSTDAVKAHKLATLGWMIASCSLGSRRWWITRQDPRLGRL